MSEPTDQNQGLTPPYYSPPTYSYGPFGPPEEPFKFPWLNLILFLLTVGSTMFFGAYMAHYDADIHKFWIFLKYNPEWWLDGLPFSITLMVILLSHELGHYFFSRHHRVASSLPYFIPAPNLVGTFGAVIFMKGKIRDRKALLDIGAAGPLAGFVVSLFALYIGLKTAKIIPYEENESMILFSPNILFYLAMAKWLPMADPAAVIKSPILDAAWVGMFVTMLNLLPIGQLDGGHIAYARLGEKTHYLSWAVIGLLLVMGILFWFGWAFFALFTLALMGPRGVKHPPPLDPGIQLDLPRRLVADLALVVFILTFIPTPFVVTGLIF